MTMTFGFESGWHCIIWNGNEATEIRSDSKFGVSGPPHVRQNSIGRRSKKNGGVLMAPLITADSSPWHQSFTWRTNADGLVALRWTPTTNLYREARQIP